jgi:hypothetical protein
VANPAPLTEVELTALVEALALHDRLIGKDALTESGVGYVRAARMAATNAAPALVAEVRRLRAIVARIAEADPDSRLGAVKVWDLPGRPGEAEGYTAEYIQGAARRVLGLCVDCNGMGRTVTYAGHGNLIDEECSTCHPGPAVGEVKP